VNTDPLPHSRTPSYRKSGWHAFGRSHRHVAPVL